MAKNGKYSVVRNSGDVVPYVPRQVPFGYQLEQSVYGSNALPGAPIFIGKPINPAPAGLSGVEDWMNVIVKASTPEAQLQQCALAMQKQKQDHDRNMLLAIVGTAAGVFLLTEVLK